jgi:hypothetical protein
MAMSLRKKTLYGCGSVAGTWLDSAEPAIGEKGWNTTENIATGCCPNYVRMQRLEEQ